MSRKLTPLLFASTIALALLSACGGGGDDSHTNTTVERVEVVAAPGETVVVTEPHEHGKDHKPKKDK